MTELGGSEGGGFQSQNPHPLQNGEGWGTQVKGVGQECPTHTGKKNPYPLLKAEKGREPHFVILNRYVVTCYVTESAASY